MCRGDDQTCPDFELHRQKLLDDLDGERRSFLKSAFLAGGGAAAAWAGGATLTTPASAQTTPGQPTYHYLPANADTVHWGYFSKLLKPQLEVDSGDFVTIEALTHHANDDAERMVKGDPGAESVFLWTKEKKGVNRRGAGPIDGKLLGRGAGEGFGVHICTGPVYVRGAELGDILEVRIMDVKPRPCANPVLCRQIVRQQRGGVVGLPVQRPDHRPETARGLHDLRNRHHRTAQLGASGLQFPLDAADRSVRRRAQDHRLSRRARRPFDGAGEPRHPEERAHPHPAAFRRDGRGAEGGGYRRLDPARLFRRQHGQLAHRQGRDHVLSGRGAGRPVLDRRFARVSRRFRIVRHRHRMSLTGTFQLILHKKDKLSGSLADLNYPLLETQDEWVLHGFSFANYLEELGPTAQQDIYKKSSIDLALRDAFRKMRSFLMNTKGLTEDEAISLISVGVDFGVTQVVDGNWGIHAIIKKSLFAGTATA